jgi:transmembrane sensor
MEDQMTYKALLNFANGKYSWNEYLKVKNWFNRIHDYKEAKQLLEAQWNELNDQQKPDDNSLRHIYEKIEYHILLEEKQETKKRRMWYFYRQAAAILLIPVLAFSLWQVFFGKVENDARLAWVEIHAPNSARTRFSLPDGSSGWLNSGSSLSYNPRFTKNRQVTLSGEAYFEVKHSNIPFNVKTVDFNVNVLGTSFNVTAYEDDYFSQVVLVDGKVNVIGKNQLFHKTLSPGERLLVYPSENKFNVNSVDIQSLTAWKEGLLLLDSEPLQLAVKRMERWYNVDIVIEDELLKKYRFKATFENEPLEEVLKLLSVSTPMKYTFEKRKKEEDGTFIKKKVRIKLKK